MKDIIKFLNDLSLGNGDKLILKKAENSYSADVYIVSGKGYYVVKRFSDYKKSEKEKRVLNLCRQRGINVPKVLFQKNEYILMEFIQGTNGDDMKLTRRDVRALGQNLKQFHSMEIDDYSVDTIYDSELMKKIYSDSVFTLRRFINEEMYYKIRTYFGERQEFLKNEKYTYVHRDYRLGNLLFSKSQIYLIDFESFAIGSPIMDLVKIIDDLAVYNREFVKEFLRAYYQRENIENSEIKTIQIYYLINKLETLAWLILRDRAEDEYYQFVWNGLNRILKEK